ncbi:MAG: transposase [Planctomycetota bacterium]|jgi:REP element-mobilizing transposase RayT
MGQRRFDEKGSWHHVWNRGAAKRPVTFKPEHVRYFQSRLARVHRRGLLEVHAYTFLLNHFHLLVRSPIGELSEALRVVQNEYVRWFNRRHKRDGSLFRGRFGSALVTTEGYLIDLVRYIDRNPVEARVVKSAGMYPFGSAIHYARERGPRWLTRDRLESIVCLSGGLRTYRPEAYREVFGAATDATAELIERRMSRGTPGPDPLDDLLGAAPEAVKAWLRRKSVLADGRPEVVPAVSTIALGSSVEGAERADPAWTVRPYSRRKSAWALLRIGLYRDACGLTCREIAMRCGCSHSTVVRGIEIHAAMLERDELYAERAAEVLAEALRLDHPSARHAGNC